MFQIDMWIENVKQDVRLITLSKCATDEATFVWIGRQIRFELSNFIFIFLFHLFICIRIMFGLYLFDNNLYVFFVF